MLSVCIPIYNYHVVPLINELSRQISNLSVPSELVLIDDCSSDHFKQMNEAACRRERYIELEENVGRARIRNLFPEHAAFDHLLFLDCDSVMVSGNFLSDYIEAINTLPSQVICGGRIYPSAPPGRIKRLRWKYGVKRESKPAHERRRSPNRSFMTNNFLIHREILSKIRFDERITRYGHEDTLFGHMLMKNNISIGHIENPVLNGDVENNDLYLQKIREGIENLVDILNYLQDDAEFVRDVTLLRQYKRLETMGAIGIISLLFKIFRIPLEKTFSLGMVNLRLFDFYKLGSFTEVYRARGPGWS